MTTPSTVPTRLQFVVSQSVGAARRGVLHTPHGVVETPAFMPVGTHGAVRGLSAPEVEMAGARVMLANAYHLYLRPGDHVVRALGGLHAFARWRGPMLTDSGGFQVFSLAKYRETTEHGVVFRSHIDGSLHEYTPESVMRIERNLGADMIMQLDELIAGGAELSISRAAMERSLRWLARCHAEFSRIETDGRAPLSLDDRHALGSHPSDDVAPPPQALLPIVQGGTHVVLRRDSMRGILGTGDWEAVAVGGLSVGEQKPTMYDTVAICAADLPADRPRYLMGVGFPDDLVECVRRGMDLFDCVAPSRMGRDGTAFTPDGKVQIRQASYRLDRRPLVDGCGCPCCTQYDRATMRHLFASYEPLGPRLLALHNITFLLDLMRDARSALEAGTFASWAEAWLERYRRAPQ